MDANVIRAITFAAALVVLLCYVLFVVWRVRVHRRRREAEEGRATNESLSSDIMLRPTPEPTRDPIPDPIPVVDAPPPSPPSPVGRPATVLEAVQGISLPHDLVPHPDAAPRPAAMDRVALTGSMLPEESLITGVDEALAALGYEVTWAETEGLARRGPTELRVGVYTSPRIALVEGVPAFPLAVEGSVVVDFWIPRSD